MYEKYFVFCVALSFSICMSPGVRAMEVLLRQPTKGGPIRYLDISLGFCNSVCRDSIRLSIDSPKTQIRRWEVEEDSVDLYVVPLKVHKKVYKDGFTVKILLEGDEVDIDGRSLYFSCFMVDGDERVLPVIKKVLLASREVIEVKPKEMPAQAPVFRLKKLKKRFIDRSFLLLNMRFLVIVLLLLLFLGFIFFDVLSLGDVALLALLGGWFFVIRRIFPYFLTEAGSIFLFFGASIWFFTRKTDSLSLERTRLVLGFCSAGLVLPMLVKAYLLWLCG